MQRKFSIKQGSFLVAVLFAGVLFLGGCGSGASSAASSAGVSVLNAQTGLEGDTDSSTNTSPDAGVSSPTFDGMVFPIDGIIATTRPNPNRVPVDTVWCGSYYYFAENYQASSAEELTLYQQRASGSGCHPGVDIAIPIGTPVRAAAAGTVVFSDYREGWGNLVVIAHQIPGVGKVHTVYGHLSKVLAASGTVNKGEYIGYSGMSGAPYPHLHFQIDRNSFPFYPSSSGVFPYNSPLHQVNRLDDIEQVKKNTFDPFVFIKENQV